jgi:hypothetical protein
MPLNKLSSVCDGEESALEPALRTFSPEAIPSAPVSRVS